MLLHAEFGQHLLLGVMDREVKDLILKLYPAVSRRTGKGRQGKEELRGHTESLVTVRENKLRTLP